MLKSRGVDFIKVQSGVPRDAYFAIQTLESGMWKTIVSAMKTT